MPTGQPITLKCPRCRRGQHGHRETEKGVSALAETRVRKLYNGRWPGGRVTFQRRAHCRDCDHLWWTTFFDHQLKLDELLERQRQLRLPGTGPAEPVKLGAS